MNTNTPVIIVSGLPRSGTSMMMQMLKAGGMEILTDGEREPDVDNPRGYHELEIVKRIKNNASWLSQASGKAVKMVYMLLHDLPEDIEYKVIFMERNIDEVVASQNKMLRRLNRTSEMLRDSEVASLFLRHLEEIKSWLAKRTNFQVIYVNYNDLLVSPQTPIERIDRFLDRRLDKDKMAAVIEPRLHRQRTAKG